MLVRSTWKSIWTGRKARITMGQRLMYRVEMLNNEGEWVLHDEYVHLYNAETWLREMGYAKEF